MERTKTRFGLIASFVILLSLISLTGTPTAGAPRESAPIPKDLDECFLVLDSTLPQTSIDTMRNWEEHQMSLAHFGLGLWIRNNWIREEKSKLRRWFNEKGIQHPDDMSAIILTSYWRYLHYTPIELDAQIKFYLDYWAEHILPDTLKCRTCVMDLKDMYTSGRGVDPVFPEVWTFVLYCKNRHPWYYSQRNGLYPLDEEYDRKMLDRFRETHK